MRQTSKPKPAGQRITQSITLPKESRDKAQTMADSDDRSFTKFVNRLINAEWERRGLGTKKAA